MIILHFKMILIDFLIIQDFVENNNVYNLVLLKLIVNKVFKG